MVVAGMHQGLQRYRWYVNSLYKKKPSHRVRNGFSVNMVRGYSFFLQIRALLFALHAPRPYAMHYHAQAE